MVDALMPTAELVAVHWLKGVPGLPHDLIATTLPERSDAFEKSGFIQVVSAGGTRDIETSMRRSVVMVDTWAYNANSQKVPWGKANQLSEQVAEATLRSARRVVLPTNFQNALVREVSMAGEPQRITGEPDYARYTLTVAMFWTPIPK